MAQRGRGELEGVWSSVSGGMGSVQQSRLMFGTCVRIPRPPTRCRCSVCFQHPCTYCYYVIPVNSRNTMLMFCIYPRM